MKLRTIKDHLSYQLHVLSNLSARTVSSRYRRKFGITLTEWRVLAILGGHGPNSLKTVERDAGLEKAYASRTIQAMIERGLVLKEVDRGDRRAVLLSLTKSGRKFYDILYGDALERNERWLAPLTDGERKDLMRLLHMLVERARELDREERALSESSSGEFAAGDFQDDRHSRT